MLELEVVARRCSKCGELAPSALHTNHNFAQHARDKAEEGSWARDNMPSRIRSIVPLVVAAVVSGCASFATEGLPRLTHEWETQLSAYLINPKLLLPGLWFGFVTGALAWRFGKLGVWGALLSLAATWIGWQLAVQAGIATFDRLSTIFVQENPKLALAGMAGGAAGALATFLGVRLSVSFPSTLVALVCTVLVGTVLGLLLVWSTTRQSVGLLLYATWQPAVVGVMGMFATSKRRGQPAEGSSNRASAAATA